MSSKKKIALIGNMNNMLFQQQRYLEDWGYDTTLFLLEEFNHFLPEADVYFDVYEKYKIVKLNWNIEDFYKVSGKEVLDIFSGFDLLIGTDVAPAYLYKANLKLDVFCLHGNDLYEYPFYRFKKNIPSLWEVNRCNFSLCQYEGVKLSKCVALGKSDALYEDPLKIIRKNGKRVATGPYLYLTQFTADYFQRSKLLKEMTSLKEQYSFLVFHHCSHNWESNKDSLIYKGNDRLIKGFAEYIHRSSAKKKACLILLEYGPDVALSKKMIAELGISENVHWLPKQKRKDLLSAIQLSDIGVGELGNQGWMVYSVIVEFMVLSKPVIHYRNSEIYKHNYKELYEMTDTNKPSEVAQTFLDHESDPKKHIAAGTSSKQWYLDNIHDPSIEAMRSSTEEFIGSDRSISILEKISHSNKIESLRVIFWKWYNLSKIKLKIA